MRANMPFARSGGAGGGSVGERFADQPPGLVGDPGQHDRRRTRTLQAKPAVNPRDIASKAAPADVGRADAQVAQSAGEALLMPWGGLEHAQRPRERPANRLLLR